MGIDLWNLQFLAEVKKRCGDLGALLQIGRQDLHVPEHSYGDADRYLAACGITMSYREATRGARWADEGLFQAFGATSVASADASPYEGADLVHDFNDPIDVSWHQRFDTVLDGGSLEHIFNVPMALANEMNLLKVGGRLLAALPANNWLGHGFYQFSPELPFRVFRPENGFRLECALLTGLREDRAFYEAADVARMEGGEIGSTPGNSTLDYIAVKTSHVKPFTRWPQQGDYDRAWEAAGKPLASEVIAAPAEPRSGGWLRRLLGAN